jgi:hypothetical protein
MMLAAKIIAMWSLLSVALALLIGPWLATLELDATNLAPAPSPLPDKSRSQIALARKPSRRAHLTVVRGDRP